MYLEIELTLISERQYIVEACVVFKVTIYSRFLMVFLMFASYKSQVRPRALATLHFWVKKLFKINFDCLHEPSAAVSIVSKQAPCRVPIKKK